MKTTLEIPDELFRRTKATAAMQGRSLKDFVAEALIEKLEKNDDEERTIENGWRKVFGKARAVHVREVDTRICEEFSRIDEESWQ